MLKSIRGILSNLRLNRSGNATLLVAIGMPALLGGAGLAVDVSQWYAWKRELQLATDQAAIAAAWARSNSVTSDTYITRGTQDYNANLALVADFASAPNIRLANYSNGVANSVIVSASATKSLPFSSILTNRGATIFATSQASFAAGGEYNACLISVGETGTTFEIGNNAHVQAQCGLAALSCSDDALVIDALADVTTDSIATCGTASVPAGLESVLTENLGSEESPVLIDQFEDLSPPTNNTARTYNCSNGKVKQASPLAGTYSSLAVACTTTFGGGIYVIDGGTLDLTGNYTVTGTNVMFVLKNGAQLKLGGSGNANTVTLTPMQSSDFQALGYSSALSDRYANMLVFEDRSSNPGHDHIINGNSTSLFQGTIYLPKGTARINGTARLDSSCLQISAYKINILGSAELDTRCPSALTNSAGSAAATVKLVV